MFSSPAPNKRHVVPKSGLQAHSTFREPRRSAASPSYSVTPVVQVDSKTSTSQRDYAADVRADVYSYRPEYTVSLLSTFPPELQQILRSNDPETLLCRGRVDTLTSFAILSMQEETFVWNYSASSVGIGSACYIFPNPSTLGHNDVPYASFVPYRSSQEPGLILCSESGAVRYWDNVSLGLTGGESFRALQLGLAGGERVLRMTRADQATFLLSSSWGRLFRLTVSSTGAKRNCHASLITDNRTLLSRVASTLFTSVVTPSQNTQSMAIACDQRPDSRDTIVWTLTTHRIQRWKLVSDAWDELTFEQQLDTILAGRLTQDVLGTTANSHPLRLEMHDITSIQNDLVILFSYDEDSGMPGAPSRVFCLAELVWLDGSLRVVTIRSLPDRFVKPGSNNFPPEMVLVGGISGVVLVCFPDGMFLQSLGPGDSFQSVLRLKSGWNRLLAADTHVNATSGSLVVQTLDSGMLSCQLDLEKIQNASTEVPSNRLRATMEQEVFFGANVENPFLFQLETQFDGGLGLAVERLSQDILNSRSEFLSRTFDLRAHISERRSALSRLIQFIVDSRVLNTLSEESRQRLWLDANRVFVGQELWSFYNRSAGESSTNGANMLLRAIGAAIQKKLGDVTGDDPIRGFFRTELSHIEVLFDELRSIVESTVSSGNSFAKLTSVMDCAEILLIIWGASETHRLSSLDLYGIGGKILVPTWGSGNAHIRIAQYLLEETVRSLEIISRRDSTSAGISQQDMETRLRDLASMTLSMWDASYDFLLSNLESPQNQLEVETFRQQFSAARAQILRSLVEWGGSATAFDLADQYHEYRFLVQLSAHPTYGGPEQIVHYLRKYREAFAFHLYKWYLENGQMSNLLEPLPEFLPLLEAFFSTNEYPRLEWIHDLAKTVSKFSSATLALNDASNSETKLESRHVMLSLTKLSALAGMETFHENAEEVQSVDRALDSISVHEMVVADLRRVLGDSDLSSTNLRGEDIPNRCIATTIASEPAFTMIFKKLAKRVLAGHALSVSELVDFLSMKDTGSRAADLGTAVLVACREKSLKHDLAGVWRRCFLADDWTIFHDALSDDALDQMLRSTQLAGCLAMLQAAGEPIKSAFISPHDVLIPLGIAELSVKHPDLTGAQVAELSAAVERECASLSALVESSRLVVLANRLLG